MFKEGFYQVKQYSGGQIVNDFTAEVRMDVTGVPYDQSGDKRLITWPSSSIMTLWNHDEQSIVTLSGTYML